ncbi:MAG TPA: relaxase/mobilization nuclease domain-containing protein [Puia sp.]
MVSRIAPTARLSDLLAYNEKKVAQHKAKLIHVGNFLQDKDKLSYDEKLHRFQHLNELNSRSTIKMFHATLNFDPADHLPDEKLAAIADRYMEGLQMQQQPYLVYRHDDAAHPHVHIVTSLIRPDGTRINTHYMAIRLSEPTRKAIETEFGLLPNKRPRQVKQPNIEELQKIVPGSGIPVTQSMDQIIGIINRDYTFSSLQEYNAILRCCNVTVETGGHWSKTRQHHGLYYVALDEQGNKISPPVMASQLASRPTYARLEKKFQQPSAQLSDNLTSIRQRIDWALFQQPDTLRELVIGLRGDDIEVIIPPRKGGNPQDHIYVDHETKTAVAGQALGKVYTSEAINRTFSQGRGRVPGRAHGKVPTLADNQVGLEGTEFNTRVPQVLSAILSHGGRDSGDQQQDQHLGHRYKR